MRTLLTVLFVFIFSFLHAQTNSLDGVSVNLNHGALRVHSKSGRYLEHKDGTPFLYLADTAWELFHRLTEEEIEFYLENRRAKGFTVIQAAILPPLAGLQTPNAYGDLALSDIHDVKPNETYFRFIDKVVRMAESKGLYMALLPTWGDKVDKQVGRGPEIFTPAYATAYGAWLGKRYRNFRNIIWINGGNCWGGDRNYPIWDALGKGLRSADKNHIITFHPQEDTSSAQWFHRTDWLDFNMIQSGQCEKGYDAYEQLFSRSDRQPVKPFLDGGGHYENYPVCQQPGSFGYFEDSDIRRFFYWSLLSGACGYAYGCNDVWQMYDEKEAPVESARQHWKKSLDLAGASQLIHGRSLWEKLDWRSGSPDNDIVLSDSSPDMKTLAFRGNGFIVVYLPVGGDITLDLEGLAGQITSARLMNPRTGIYQTMEIPVASGETKLSAPFSGEGNDFILIIQY